MTLTILRFKEMTGMHRLSARLTALTRAFTTTRVVEKGKGKAVTDARHGIDRARTAATVERAEEGTPFVLRRGALLKTPQRRLRSIPREEVTAKEGRALQTKLERKLEALRNKVRRGQGDEEANQAALVKMQRSDDRAKATSSSISEQERNAAFDRLGLGEDERKSILSRLALKKEAKFTPVYFPSNIVRLVRPPDGTSAYEAHFRVSNSMTQPDLRDYLESIYQLKIKDIRTMNYIAPLKKTINGMMRAKPGRGARTFKKAIVDLVEPFWYPPELTAQQLETKFRKTEYESASRNYLMKLKGWRVRGTQTTKQRLKEETEKRMTHLELLHKATREQVADSR